jgi:ABC-type Mn2+/Zn2+ transport system permease subunit
VSSAPREAIAAGVYVRLWDFLFYSAFALVVVSFVRLAGVLLTFAYLIVPAVCAVMLAERWMPRLVIGWVIAAVASLLGLWASYRLDLPTGAAIVCACGLLLILVAAYAALRKRVAAPDGASFDAPAEDVTVTARARKLTRA